MTAPPEKLPRDLQGRLDVILAKPVLRRCPALQQAIEILVRNAYERKAPMELSGAQRSLLLQLQAEEYPPPTLDEVRETARRQIPIGNSDTGDFTGYERKDRER